MRYLIPILFISLAAGCGEDERYYPGDLADPAAITPPANPRTVEELFPATGLRGLVINRCSTCHSVACSTLGQRSDEEWDEVEYSHQNYIPGLSIEDRGKIFDYLKRNFGENQPEPQVPPEFLEGGCPALES